MGLVIWILGELILGVLANLPFFWREAQTPPSSIRWAADVVGALIVGGLIGLLSAILWRHSLLMWTSLRWTNLILTPLLVTTSVVIWRRHRSDVTRTGLVRTGIVAFCLSSSLVTVRHFSIF